VGLDTGSVGAPVLDAVGDGAPEMRVAPGGPAVWLVPAEPVHAAASVATTIRRSMRKRTAEDRAM
jgi:hypothetical protein